MTTDQIKEAVKRVSIDVFSQRRPNLIDFKIVTDAAQETERLRVDIASEKWLKEDYKLCAEQWLKQAKDENTNLRARIAELDKDRPEATIWTRKEIRHYLEQFIPKELAAIVADGIDFDGAIRIVQDKEGG